MFFPKGEPGGFGKQGPKGERGSEVSRKKVKNLNGDFTFLLFADYP